jgi:RNA binding exosome subunit
MKSRKGEKWIHPVHGRGYKSPQFDGALRPLTDKKINEYILRGHYGEEARLVLEAQMKLKKRLTPQQILKNWMKLMGLK